MVEQVKNEPKIIGFLCNWCSYAGADLAGVSRFQYPPNLRIIRLMCSGRVDPYFIIESFLQGADGVFIGGCHPGDCHYLTGNLYAERKIKLAKKMLEISGFQAERLRLEWIAASEGELFARTIKEFTNRIQELGPSPITGPNPDMKILSKLKTVQNSVIGFRLRALVGKERKIVEEGNVYGEKKTQEEWDEMINQAMSAEYERNMILLLTDNKPMSVKELASELEEPTDEVLQHIVYLRKNNLVAMDSIDGTTPKYVSLVQEGK
jgi:coenzyme F420-reducing hydrogenase delta subunit/DNA-binding transcriptional ArsR family regulator